MKPLAVLFLILLLTTGCTASVDPSPPITESPPQTLRITWPTYGGRGQAVARTLETYGHPVDLIGGDEDLSAITTLLDTGYDGVLVLPYRYVQSLGAEGRLRDLADPFAWDEALFYPGIWSLGVVEEKLNAVPWVTHSICLLYNADLLQEAEVDPETINSPEALLIALEQVETATEAHGIGLVGADHHDLSWQFNMIFQGFGGTLLAPSADRVAMDRAITERALTYYRDELGRQAQADWTDHDGNDTLRLFREGKVAFVFQGPWGITEIEKNGRPFETGVLRPDQLGLAAEVGPMMLGMPKDLSEEAVARNIELIDHLIGIDAQLEIMKGEYSPEHDRTYLFRLPARRDLDRHLYEDYRTYLPFMRAAEHPSIDVPHPAWQRVKDNVYTPLLARFMRREITTEQFLEGITREGNRTLEDQGSKEE